MAKASKTDFKLPVCQYCGGTGTEFRMKSWFVTDGLTKHVCTSCKGTGRNAYQGHPSDWVAFQKKLRHRAIDFGFNLKAAA